jgi:malonyl CoA-acyl carrier protein transacylase
MLNDLLKSNEDIIENFDNSFYNIINYDKEKDLELNNLVNIINNTQNKNFNFSDLLLLKENDNEYINKLKREVLNKTKFAQPAILLHSYLNYNKFLKEKFNYEGDEKENNIDYAINKNINNTFSYFFGPSLGEIISLVCANSITLNKAGTLLHIRGRLMQESCPNGRGAMLNVVGDINKNINLFNLFINNNKNEEINLSSIMSNRLIVLSGATDSIEKCRIFFKENSIGCRKLIVSAAFHSDLMIEGSLKFKDYLFDKEENIFFDFPKIPIISTIYPEFVYPRKNSKEAFGFDNNPIEFDTKVKEMLVDQFTRKVDLMNCVKNLVELSKKDNEDNKIIECQIYDIIKRKNLDLNEFL